jgi:glutathione S-transferase
MSPSLSDFLFYITRKDPHSYSPLSNADVSAAGNPLAKIPTLVVTESGPAWDAPVGIFDSKFICAYLLQRAGLSQSDDQSSRRYWQEQVVHAACDGMMDAEILVAYEERLRAEKGLKWQPWVDGQREKVVRGMDFLEGMVGEGVVKATKEGEAAGVAEVAVAVVLSMFDGRVPWREGRPGLEAFYKIWQGRESFVRAVSTREADWKRDVL